MGVPLCIKPNICQEDKEISIEDLTNEFVGKKNYSLSRIDDD